MKKILFAAGAYALAAGIVFGQANMILQHARNLSDQNNARQRAMMGESPQAGAKPGQQMPQAPPPDPLQPSIDKIAADFAVLQTDASDAAKRALSRNIMEAVRNFTKPTDVSVGKLANDMANALSGRDLSQATLTVLAQCLAHMVNNEGVANTDFPTTSAYFLKLLKSSGTPHSQVDVVSSDFTIVQADAQMVAADAAAAAAK